MLNLKTNCTYLLIFSFFIALISNAYAINNLSLASDEIPICTHNGLIYLQDDGSLSEKPENNNYHADCLDCFYCHLDEIQITSSNIINYNTFFNKKLNLNNNHNYKSSINYLKNIRAPPRINI